MSETNRYALKWAVGWYNHPSIDIQRVPFDKVRTPIRVAFSHPESKAMLQNFLSSCFVRCNLAEILYFWPICGRIFTSTPLNLFKTVTNQGAFCSPCNQFFGNLMVYSVHFGHARMSMSCLFQQWHRRMIYSFHAQWVSSRQCDRTHRQGKICIHTNLI